MNGYLTTFTDTPIVNKMMVMSAGNLAFDIGANAGYVAKTLARAFDKVVACEPCLESFEHMIPRCPIPNLICLNVAVSDHEGTVTLGEKEGTETMGELFTGDSLYDVWGPDTGQREVECTTLDRLAELYGYPDFVKIDTEGHEGYIVDGGHKVFEQHPKFIIEIHDLQWGDQIAAYFDKIDLKHEAIRHVPYLDNADGTKNYHNHYWMVSK